jgi:cation diffusion facilitator CzcD-associated flavoprotein CzcO
VTSNNVDVLIIGAGQAGLSAAYHLRRAHIDFVLLDADAAPGGAWQHRWSGLRMETVHGVHDLPGMPKPHLNPDEPANTAIPAYFADYEKTFNLPVVRPVKVRQVTDDNGRLRVETDSGVWVARALINATGTWRHPFIPYYPGAETFSGRQLHTAHYPGPEPFRNQHVIVVGGGTSAMHHLAEISDIATTTWVTRRPPVFRTEEFSPEVGRAVVAMVEERVRAGLPPQSVVGVTGLPENDVVRKARANGALDRLPLFDRLTPDGALWDDGRFVRADSIVWATGFRAALDHLAPLHLRAPGGGITMDGTQVVADPRVQLVGYGPSASTIGANRAGREAARNVRRFLTLEPSTACPTR